MKKLIIIMNKNQNNMKHYNILFNIIIFMIQLLHLK